MNIKDLQKDASFLLRGDAYEMATCSFCGRARREVAVLCEGKTGYACSDCGRTLVGAFAAQDQRGHGAYLAEVLHEALGSLDLKLPFAHLDRFFEAALLLADGDATILGKLAAEAFRFGYHAKARDILSRIPRHARNAHQNISLLAALLVLNDRPALRDTFEDVEKFELTDEDRLFVQSHRAYAAFRLDAPGEPTFPMDPAMLPSLLRQAQKIENRGLVSQILEVMAACERSRNRYLALTHIDEAILAVDTASKHVLRGDLFDGRDPIAARAAWTRAIELSHPDGIWAQRARARLERATVGL